jgi:hypothetical protein
MEKGNGGGGDNGDGYDDDDDDDENTYGHQQTSTTGRASSLRGRKCRSRGGLWTNQEVDGAVLMFTRALEVTAVEVSRLSGKNVGRVFSAGDGGGGVGGDGSIRGGSGGDGSNGSSSSRSNHPAMVLLGNMTAIEDAQWPWLRLAIGRSLGDLTALPLPSRIDNAGPSQPRALPKR